MRNGTMKNFAIVVVVASVMQGVFAERIYLSGKGPADAVEWEFKCSEGRKSGQWTTIPVPSNWEQHGFGNYDYGHVAPHEKHDEVGTYRVRFNAPKEWKDNVVRLVFEGSMTDTSVKLNGKPVGTMNQGGYNQFHILLTDTGKYGQHAFKVGQENELEIRVSKISANTSLEWAERKADYWVFGGIYRPVYLEVLPKAFINRIAIDAEADGQFKMDVFPQVHLSREGSGRDRVDEVVAQIETLDGKSVGVPMVGKLSGGGAPRVRLESRVPNVNTWSPEFPDLYRVRVSLKLKGKTLHEKTERFGFRTLELRPKDGLYLNGQKIRMRGVNRNGFRPDTARALDTEEAWEDARAIKEMNANTVRCHLPPSKAFLEACDELGLLFIIERTNWQRPVADTAVARQIVYDQVTRFHNHPSLVMWANGNESGFNHEVDELFALLDLQERPVIHPWAVFDGIDTRHYLIYGDLQKRLKEKPNVLLPTELLHGLYDGGHGAGLDDYWNVMRKSDLSAGGVLWCWADAAIERTDMNGKLDTDGNHSADGIVGPYGEKEGSYFAIREIWSPIQIPVEQLPENFDGTLSVENRFYETSLNQCVFAWRLRNYGSVEKALGGKLKGPAIAPGKTGELKLPLPKGWKSAGGLELVALAPDGTEIMHWAWPLNRFSLLSEMDAAPQQVPGKPFRIQLGETLWSFSPDTGHLLSCTRDGQSIGFGKGPELYAATEKGKLNFSNHWKTKIRKQGDAIVIESSNEQGSAFKWTLASGGVVQLDYEFPSIGKELTYCAVGFDLNEEEVISKLWAGDGPFRIWGNRRKGPQFGLWDNEYNNGITGVNFIYPEFKGVFGKVDSMNIRLKSDVQLLLEPSSPADIGILRPENATGDKLTGPKKAKWAYPENGGLFLFHKVPAIGTKFKDASALGPQSRPRKINGPIKGTVRFQVQ
jgi:hypothetical protein